jgi:RsiW-degrading membrane proteinase PrsW (M82 family)
MSPWLSIPAGFVPCLAWLWLVHRSDDHEREPPRLVLLAMALGSAAALAVLFVRPWIETYWQPDLLVDAFVLTALGEELWKLLAFAPLLLHRELDEPLDGAIYGAAVALGFAGVENALYAQWTDSLEIVAQRAFTSTLLHAGCTAAAGYALAGAKLALHRHVGPSAYLGYAALLLAAVVLHGAYDWLLLAFEPGVLAALLLVLPTTVWLLRAVLRWGRAHSARYHPPHRDQP